MKSVMIFFMLFVLLATLALLVATAAAQIKIIDADAVLEMNLQSVSIPTKAVSLAKIFMLNENAGSTKALSTISIPTQATPLKKLFVINEKAISTKALLCVITPVQRSPVTELFIINAEAILVKDLVALDATTPSVGPSTISSFTLSLDDGLNMCSLPLSPEVSLTARSFAQQLAATMIIKYDTQQDEFVPFVPEVFSGDGFPIDGGQGYIVNMLDSREVTFTGTAWSNAPAKPISAAPSSKEPDWAFVVCGVVYDENTIAPITDLAITVKNSKTACIAEAVVGSLENGRYAVAFVDPGKKDVVDLGDVLEIHLKDTRTGAISKLITHTVISLDLTRNYVELPMRLDYFNPEKNELLQNYPNPFNPDTWIPYQLSEDSHVVIRLYTATGQIIRTLNLGHRNAGFYTNRERAGHWDGRNESGEQVSSGIYFYSIEAGSFAATGKMTVAR